MLVINTKEDEKRCKSPYGDIEMVLTEEEIYALLAGKTLGDPDYDEYGIFIRMKQSEV